MAVNCGREACKTGVKRFIHMSTAQVYDCDKVREGGVLVTAVLIDYLLLGGSLPDQG